MEVEILEVLEPAGQWAVIACDENGEPFSRSARTWRYGEALAFANMFRALYAGQGVAFVIEPVK